MNIKEANQLLNNVIEILIDETSDANLKGLQDRLESIVEVVKVENNYIYVSVKDNLKMLLIKKFDSRQMDTILEQLLPEKYGFKFMNQADADVEKQKNDKLIPSNNKIDLSKASRKLKPDYTFDNFVPGNSNRFAYTAAIGVAESPGRLYNPLYIFGDVGHGKTHLMVAVGNYILDNDINTNIVYIKTEQFVEEYFLYTKRDLNNIEDFYNTYKSADVLLVDDIQFLENKQKTQEEFFKIFDYLHGNGKQIVITSDRPSSSLKIMERLKSRFAWGMPVDIKAPDKDLRIGILQKKLSFLVSNPKTVPNECLDMIADYFSSNVRELEGALTRFVSYCIAMGLPFDTNSVKIALEGMVSFEKESIGDNVTSKLDKIVDIVTDYFRISKDDLLSPNRKPKLVYARNISYYISQVEFSFTLSKIGEYFNKKDHTSISYGINKIKEQINTDVNIKNDIAYIKDKLI